MEMKNWRRSEETIKIDFARKIDNNCVVGHVLKCAESGTRASHFKTFARIPNLFVCTMLTLKYFICEANYN